MHVTDYPVFWYLLGLVLGLGLGWVSGRHSNDWHGSRGAF